MFIDDDHALQVLSHIIHFTLYMLKTLAPLRADNQNIASNYPMMKKVFNIRETLGFLPFSEALEHNFLSKIIALLRNCINMVILLSDD